MNEMIGFMNKYNYLLYDYWVGHCFAVIDVTVQYTYHIRHNLQNTRKKREGFLKIVYAVYVNMLYRLTPIEY